MHIALITPFPCESTDIPNTNGVPLYAYHLASGLIAHRQPGDRIDVFAPYEQESNTARCSMHVQTEGKTNGNVRVHRCFGRNVWGFLRLIFVLRKHPYDVIHFQHETFLFGGPLTIFAFPFLVWLLKRKTSVVVTLHHVVSQKSITDDFLQLHHSPLPPRIIRWGYEFFYRALGKAAPQMIVHNTFFRDILMQEYGVSPLQVTVIPHGVEDPTRLTTMDAAALKKYFGIPAGTRTVFGYFGFIAGYKGVDYLLDEYARHAQKNEGDVLLFCGGDHPHYKKDASYRAYVRTLKEKADSIPGNRVIWLGFLDGSKVDEFYSVIDCIVLPYRSNFGASGPLALAIGSGKPILASEQLRCFLPEPAGVFPLQEGALAGKLTAFHNLSQQERQEMASEINAEKGYYHWNHIGQLTYEFYQSVSEKQTPGKLLLLGAYGQQNLGDELLLKNCLSFLNKNDCVVASAQPSLTQESNGVATVDSQRHPLRKLLAFLRAKTVVVGGGDQFKLFKKSVGRFRYALVAQYFLIALLSRMLGKNLYFVGIGIGDVYTALARLLTRWTLRLATFSTFRDARSFAFAEKYAPRAPMALASDLAFLEETKEQECARPRRSDTAHTLGIAPVFNIDHAEAFPLVTKRLGAAIDGFLGEGPRNRAVFLPFQTGFNAHHDIMTSGEILNHTQQNHRCTVDEGLNTQSVTQAYQSLDFLWGMRLHSLILACMHAVPFIALIYDVKVRNFLKEIDYTDWSISLDASFSAEKLLALQKGLEEHTDEIRHHLASQAQKLRRKARINAEVLQCIDEGRPVSCLSGDDMIVAIAQSGYDMPIACSPLPRHHALMQSQWKK
ncbi:MAG: polysaccharide pyruvyl transferase family protein [Candidatus Peribacteraceae bacterium]|nr:polysaccharide pyruvyl transferase family protein [Candidatus Peribacteraceae bacterium]MDD5075039.1 polysaccharide pyruvyl transferase family protein [Candidatus Peribacteraceae bacterium]